MTEHPTKQELDDYGRRVLTPAAFLSIHRHIVTCAICARRCNSPRQLARDLGHLREALVLDSDGAPYHVSAAERIAYLQDKLDEIDLEIVESHLTTCNSCLEEMQRPAAERERVVPSQIEPATFKPRRFGVGLLTVNRWRVAAVVAFGALLILSALWLLRTRAVQQKNEARSPIPVSTPGPSQAQVESGSPASEAPTPQDLSPTLIINDGGSKVTMDSKGTLSGLEQLPAHLHQKVNDALRSGKLEQPAILAQLNGGPSTLLSESGDGLPFQLLGPLGQVIRDPQPTFRWHALAGAESYKVVVTDADLNEVAISPSLNTTEWHISQPLKQGGIYSWQVTATKAGTTITSPVLPAAQAKFRIIDRSTAETLQQAEHAASRSHLTLGVLYGEAGLLNEAERELRALVRENPRVDIAHKLLRSVQAMKAQISASSRD